MDKHTERTFSLVLSVEHARVGGRVWFENGKTIAFV